MKIIEKHIGRHENGNLYLVIRKNGKLTLRSLKTTNLAEAQRKIREMGTLALTAAREPAIPFPTAPEPTAIEVVLAALAALAAPAAQAEPTGIAGLLAALAALAAPSSSSSPSSSPSISLAEALDKHLQGLVLLTKGTRGMASLGQRVILKFCEDWASFKPVTIYNDYRESGTKRTGKRTEMLTSAANHLRWYMGKFVPWAVSQGFLPQEAIVTLATIPNLKINPRQIRIPATSVVNEFLTMVESEDPEGGAYLRFLAVTGLRKTGALTLRWRDIDFNRGTMLVLQKGGIRKSIPMTPEAVLALKGRTGSAHPYPLDDNAMNRLKNRVKRFAKGFDIDLTNNHSFRHYFASSCLIAGLTVQEVAKLLGHADQGQLVLKTYGHLCGDHLKDAVSKLRLAS